MTATQPTRKDMAEFFRLSLLTGLCEPSAVVRWADYVVAAEQSPHIAFIELCTAGLQPISSIQTLLDDVPGQASPDLPVQMLLGHASRLVTAHAFTPERLLLRLYRMASLETFPESIYYELSAFEDELSLARDGVYGTVSEFNQDFAAFLATYESYVPNTSSGNA